jgi:hypothetical protein
VAKRRTCGELSGSLNKKGEPCGAYARKGKTTCMGHADKVEQESAGFGGPQEGAGRPRKPRPSEIALALVEDNAAVLLEPYFATLGYSFVMGDNGPELVKREQGGAKVTATYEGAVIVSDVDDLAAQVAVAEKLKDRLYGRPRQEITGADGQPLQLEVTGAAILSDPDARKHAAGLRRRVGATRAEQPGRARSRD